MLTANKDKNPNPKTNDRDEFIAKNLNLVHSLSHRYTGRGIEYEDLYSAGCVGLVKAYDGFDQSRGFSFSTYAVPVILGEIKRLFRDGGSIKVSRSIKDLALKIGTVEQILENELMRKPTIGEIAQKLNVSIEEVAVAIDSSKATISLTSSNDDDEGKICDIPSEDNEDKLVAKIALKQALDKLCEQDKKLIYLRFFEDKTQSQVADYLNMTQVSVSRRERAILLKLREYLK